MDLREHFVLDLLGVLGSVHQQRDLLLLLQRLRFFVISHVLLLFCEHAHIPGLTGFVESLLVLLAVLERRPEPVPLPVVLLKLLLGAALPRLLLNHRPAAYSSHEDTQLPKLQVLLLDSCKESLLVLFRPPLALNNVGLAFLVGRHLVPFSLARLRLPSSSLLCSQRYIHAFVNHFRKPLDFIDGGLFLFDHFLHYF